MLPVQVFCRFINTTLGNTPPNYRYRGHKPGILYLDTQTRGSGRDLKQTASCIITHSTSGVGSRQRHSVAALLVMPTAPYFVESQRAGSNLVLIARIGAVSGRREQHREEHSAAKDGVRDV
ncbi:uncharacterized protein LOC125225443 [Leguminivora glycinivorella]|uniref:uncharacterized protein LOC125225443 n=1 Tax=Leguminivora glycinivorella TaxID=1035111 RepID=UPI00200D6A17|nr:uncharacterized protein LOC125225443 [Leguminivora glycinivorella]